MAVRGVVIQLKIEDVKLDSRGDILYIYIYIYIYIYSRDILKDIGYI